MTTEDEPAGIERRDEWALAELDAAVGVVGAAVGAMYGPEGAILGAFVGPYAKLAVKRFMDLRTRIADEVDLDDEELRSRLEENESLAQMIAEVVRGTVESDLDAKRRLLARAAIHALQDDAVVDIEARFVRTATEVDTLDVRVLAIVGQIRRDPSRRKRSHGMMSMDMVESRLPGGAKIVRASSASLVAAGLAEDPSPGSIRQNAELRVTDYGAAFLDRLLAEGLEDELRRRAGEGV